MANGKDKDESGFWGFVQRHPFLSFFLAGAVIGIPASIVEASKPVPPPPPNPLDRAR